MSITPTLITSPQANHAHDACFDHSVLFAPRREVTQSRALVVASERISDIVAISKAQDSLEEDLKKAGNIVFIGDTHLCHEFNEKAFDEILNTLEAWMKAGKKVSRVVLYGDLVHKFDSRFSQLTEHGNKRFRAPVEPFLEVKLRLEKVFKKLDRLRSILGDETPIDFIYGNHEQEINQHHSQADDLLKGAFRQFNIRVLTEDFNQLVEIGDKDDRIKMSHRPVFKWGEHISEKLFGSVYSLFKGLNKFLNFEEASNQNLIKEGDIVLGAHFHVPVVLNDRKNIFAIAPSLIENFSSSNLPNFPEAFMVINPKASRKIHMVGVDGRSMEYLAV